MTYTDDHPYKEILNRLLDRLDYIRITPKTILIVGWQMDFAQKKLQQRYADSDIKIARDLADIHQYGDQQFDLVVAYFALPREPKPLLLLQAFYHVMRDESLLLFTDLGPDTFCELRESFSSVDQYLHVMNFTDMHHIGDAMRRLHFSDPVVDREEVILAYDELNLFFKDLKELGATKLFEKRYQGLMPKNKWQTMLSSYEKFKTDGYFPVTLEIIYGHGWKIKTNKNISSGEIAISVDAIRTRIKS